MHAGPTNEWDDSPYFTAFWPCLTHPLADSSRRGWTENLRGNTTKRPHLASKIQILNGDVCVKTSIWLSQIPKNPNHGSSTRPCRSPLGIHGNVPPHGTRYAVAAFRAATLEPLLPAAPALHRGGPGCASAGAVTVRPVPWCGIPRANSSYTWHTELNMEAKNKNRTWEILVILVMLLASAVACGPWWAFLCSAPAERYRRWSVVPFWEEFRRSMWRGENLIFEILALGHFIQ